MKASSVERGGGNENIKEEEDYEEYSEVEKEKEQNRYVDEEYEQDLNGSYGGQQTHQPTRGKVELLQAEQEGQRRSMQQNSSRKSLDEAEFNVQLASGDAGPGYAKVGTTTHNTRALSGKEGVSRGSRYNLQQQQQQQPPQGLAQNRGGGSVKRGINSSNVITSAQPGRLVSSQARQELQRGAHPSAAPGGRGAPAASAGRPVYQRKINPTQQVLDQYRSAAPTNARNSRRLNNPMASSHYGQQSKQNAQFQVAYDASIPGSGGLRPSKREPGAGPHADKQVVVMGDRYTSASKRAIQYNQHLNTSQPNQSNHAGARPEDLAQHHNNNNPLSHSSQMDSQHARPVAAINYKDIVLAEGVEMFKQKQAKKEAAQELAQMQNRIRLLQLQEQKIKRRNEQQSKKIEVFLEQKRKVQEEKELQEQRRQREQAEIERKHAQLKAQKEQERKQRQRSEYRYQRQQRQEQQKLRQEKEERMIQIRRQKGQESRRKQLYGLRESTKGASENGDAYGGSSFDHGDPDAQSMEIAGRGRPFVSGFMKRQQENEKAKRERIEASKREYRDRLGTERRELEKNKEAIKRLQKLESKLVDQVQQQTMAQRQVQAEFDEILSRKAPENPRRYGQTGQAWMSAAADRASLNADLSRPTTSENGKGTAAARGFQADVGPAGADADQLGMVAPKAIPPKQLAGAWPSRTPKAADVGDVGYESDDHKPGADEQYRAEFLTGVEQNINEEDQLLEDQQQKDRQQQAEVAQAYGDAEQARPLTRQNMENKPIGEVEQEAQNTKELEESQISANPAAGRIPEEQCGPQRYEPSPVRDDAGDCYQHETAGSPEASQSQAFADAEEENHVQEFLQREELADSSHHSSQHESEAVDIQDIEKNLENEDMLAITMHNQQMLVKNANLDKLTEKNSEHNVTERDLQLQNSLANNLTMNGSTPSGFLRPNASIPERRPQATSQQKLRGPDPLEGAIISRTVNDDSGNEKIDENASESEDDYEDDHMEEAPKDEIPTAKAPTPKPVAKDKKNDAEAADDYLLQKEKLNRLKEKEQDSEEYSEDEAHEEVPKPDADLKNRIDESDQDENASFEELSDGDLKTHSSGREQQIAPANGK